MRVGERLIEAGLVSENVLDAGLRTQGQYGGRLLSVLVDLRGIDGDAATRILSTQKRAPAALKKHFDAADRTAIARLPAKVAEKYGAIPLGFSGHNSSSMVVAMLDPGDFRAVEELQFIIGMKIMPGAALEIRIRDALKRYYGIGGDKRQFLGVASASGDMDDFGESTSYAVKSVQTVQAPSEAMRARPAIDLTLDRAPPSSFDPPSQPPAASPSRAQKHLSAPPLPMPNPLEMPAPHAPAPMALPLPLYMPASPPEPTGPTVPAPPRVAAQAISLDTWASGPTAPPMPLSPIPAGSPASAVDSWSSGPTPAPFANTWSSGPTPVPPPPTTAPVTAPAAPAPLAASFAASFPAPVTPASAPPAMSHADALLPPTLAPPPMVPAPSSAPPGAPSAPPNNASNHAPRDAPTMPQLAAVAPPISDVGALSPLLPKAAPTPLPNPPPSRPPARGGFVKPIPRDDPDEGRSSASKATPDALGASDAIRRIDQASSLEQKVDLLLVYMKGSFEACMIFAVRNDIAFTWKAFGPGIRGAPAKIAIPLTQPSLLQTPYEARTVFCGAPTSADASMHARLWETLRTRPPREALAVPIVIEDKVAAIVYAHPRPDQRVTASILAETQSVCAAVSRHQGEDGL